MSEEEDRDSESPSSKEEGAQKDSEPSDGWLVDESGRRYLSYHVAGKETKKETNK